MKSIAHLSVLHNHAARRYNFSRQVIGIGKDVSFKNTDRFIQLGIAIASMRKYRGMSQEDLAAKAEISRTYLSHIEAPGMAYGFSLEVFFNIADALDVDPAVLINASMFPDMLIRKR